MKNILLGITTVGVLFTACNSSSQPEKDTSLPTPATEVSTTPATVNPAAQETISNQALPNQVQPLPNTVSPGTMPKPGAVTAGLNPEHGQPNHRCDIAVGAPLNSPAPSATPAPAASTPIPSAVQPSIPSIAKPVLPTAGASSGKINPPHGEPGHSCAVSVGAVLP